MNKPAHVAIDLRSITTAPQLHAALAAALDFPSMYGMNWDAFHDAIMGLVEMPQQLELVGWPALQPRLPRDAALLQRCLARMAQEMPVAAAQVHYR